MSMETVFEKPRGVDRVEVRDGYAQVHVSNLKDPIMSERLHVTEAVANAGISLDFLKLTPSGLSFLVPEERSVEVDATLSALGVKASVSKSRSILLVHAVNMRDEEGLIGSIVQEAIASGAVIDHIGDMHDRMLLVMGSQQAQFVADHLEKTLRGKTHAG